MPHSPVLPSQTLTDFSDVFSKLRSSTLSVDQTAGKRYAKLSQEFNMQVRNLEQLKDFILSILERDAFYPNTCLFNQIIQYLATSHKTTLILKVLEIMEHKCLVDAQSYKILLTYLGQFKTPKPSLLKPIFFNAIQHKNLYDSYTFKLYLNALSKTPDLAIQSIFNILHLSIQKQACNEHICIAGFKLLQQHASLSAEHLLSMFSFALRYGYANTELISLLKTIYLQAPFSHAADFGSKIKDLFHDHPNNHHEAEILLQVLETCEHLPYETLIAFHKKIHDRQLINNDIRIKLLNLAYQHQYELMLPMEFSLMKHIPSIKIDLTQSKQHFDISILNPAETYYLLKDFFKKNMFLKSSSTVEIQFMLSAEQEDAFFKACTKQPKLLGDVQKIDKNIYQITLDTQNTQLLVSQYSAFTVVANKKQEDSISICKP